MSAPASKRSRGRCAAILNARSRQGSDMRCTLIMLGCALALSAAPAAAEMGPCKPDKFDGFMCGSGANAARVVDETLSPSKAYALAWRVKDGEIEEEPDTDKIELLLVRMSDGAILNKSGSEYWNTG